MVSQFVYKLLCTYTPDETIFKTFRKIVTNFIWDSRKPKIAYERLVQPYELNGLKLVDLKLTNRSLKAGWVDRLIYSEDTQFPWIKAMLPYNHPDIWESIIKPVDIDKPSSKSSKIPGKHGHTLIIKILKPGKHGHTLIIKILKPLTTSLSRICGLTPR